MIGLRSVGCFAVRAGSVSVLPMVSLRASVERTRPGLAWIFGSCRVSAIASEPRRA